MESVRRSENLHLGILAIQSNLARWVWLTEEQRWVKLLGNGNPEKFSFARRAVHVIFNSTFGLARDDPCQAQGKVSKLKGERDHLYF